MTKRLKIIILAFVVTITLVLSVCIVDTFRSKAMSEGWRESGGGWWYEFSDGSYARSEYINGYWLDSAGWYDSAWDAAWFKDSNGWWYQSGSWYPVDEWVKIDKKWYHFNNSGYMDLDKWIGNSYVGSDGAWIPDKSKDNSKDKEEKEENKESKEMVMRIDGTKVDVNWEENASVEELEELAASGLSISMSMYGGFEQVGSLGKSITQNDKQMTTGAGDIVLYSGNQLVVFYGSNSWAYTKLGKINMSQKELADLLGKGDVTITISME